jgi:quercetin dioxygenase-like cupin family protein
VTEGVELDDCTRVFSPPVPEFSIQSIKVAASRAAPYELGKAPSAAILLCISGSGTASVSGSPDTALAAGGVFLEPAGVATALTATEDLVLFRVHTSLSAK